MLITRLSVATITEALHTLTLLLRFNLLVAMAMMKTEPYKRNQGYVCTSCFLTLNSPR